MTLNEKDLERLVSPEGNHLITGPPGSGKTHTLVRLTKYLIVKKDLDPRDIIIFSFSRRWSKILRELTAAAVGRSMWEIPIETFYSFCIDLLEWYRLEGYGGGDGRRLQQGGRYGPGKKIRVLNSVEQWNRLAGIVRDVDRKDYPYSHRYVNSSTHVLGSYLQEVFDFILRAQENLLEPGVLLNKYSPERTPLLAELSGIYSRYSRTLNENGEYNYGMILMQAAKLLEEDQDFRRKVRDKYRYIIVDELQETNTAQFRIISMMAHDNCIFFGNDDQALFGFRGASPDNFKQVFRELKAMDRIVFLDKNHRSTVSIQKLSSSFLVMDDTRITEKPYVCSEGRDDGEIAVSSFPTAVDETGYICEKIKQLKSIHGVRLEDMAVLVKGLGYETHLVEDALKSSGIPFIRRSSRSLTDNRYISYIMDVLKLISAVDIEEEAGDITGSGRPGHPEIKKLLQSVLLSETVDMDPLYVSHILSSHRKENKKHPISLWTYMDRLLDEGPGLTGQDSRNIQRLSQVMGRIRHYATKIDMDIRDILLELLDDPLLGVFRYFNNTSGRDADVRQAAISTGDYLRSVMEFAGGQDTAPVRSYLRFVEDLEVNQFLEEIEESTEEQVQPGMVNILSFHQCKGMEFGAVFVPFINKNYLPSRFKNQQSFDINMFRALVSGKEPLPEELKKEHFSGEARLLYNAITRAKTYLYITCSRTRGDSVFFEKIREICSGLTGEDNISLTDGADQRKYPDRAWLLKKKAMVPVLRLQKGLKTDQHKMFSTFLGLGQIYPPGKWWGNIKSTVNETVPVEVFRKPYSYTGLETFRECPFKYKIRHFLGIPDQENMAIILGRSYHQILQRFFDGRKNDYSWNRLRSIIDEVLGGLDPGFPSLKREIMDRALSDFKRYLEKLLPGTPHLSIMEQGFSFRLKDFEMTGHIDQINMGPDGSMELVDFKSGSSRYSKKDLADEIQLKLYRLAVENDSSFRKNAGKRILMKYVSLGDDKKGEYFIPDELYSREEIEAKIAGIAERIAGEDFPAQPKDFMTCTYCDYQLLCPRFYGK